MVEPRSFLDVNASCFLRSMWPSSTSFVSYLLMPRSGAWTQVMVSLVAQW